MPPMFERIWITWGAGITTPQRSEIWGRLGKSPQVMLRFATARGARLQFLICASEPTRSNQYGSPKGERLHLVEVLLAALYIHLTRVPRKHHTAKFAKAVCAFRGLWRALGHLAATPRTVVASASAPTITKTVRVGTLGKGLHC